MSFGDWLNPDVREKDVKLLMFGAVALFGITKLGFAPITPDWVNAFYGLCALVGLGGGVLSAVEKWKGGKPQDGAQ